MNLLKLRKQFCKEKYDIKLVVNYVDSGIQFHSKKNNEKQ